MQSEQSLGVPEHSPPKDLGKQDPRMDPDKNLGLEILTEQPPDRLQV